MEDFISALYEQAAADGTGVKEAWAKFREAYPGTLTEGEFSEAFSSV